MPGLTQIAVIACAVSAGVGMGMALLVFSQAPRARENQLMSAYFLIAAYGAGEVFLARILSFVGVDAAPFFYESYVAGTMSLLALLALVTETAGLWSRPWVPLSLFLLLLLVGAVEMPMMHAGRLLRVDGYGGDGQLEVHLTALGQLLFLGVLGAGLVVLGIAWRFPRARSLIPGLALGVLGPVSHLLVPTWRPFPVSVIAAAGSSVLLAYSILRSKLFDPLARLNRELRAEVEERGALIGELQAFAGSVAHDLKGPLGPILGAAQILEEDGDQASPERRRECVQMIRRNGESIAHIVDSLGLLARLRHLEITSRPLDMTSIVEAALQRLAPEIREMAAVVDRPSQWPVAVGFAPLVEEMWVSYLSNAIKFGGRPPRVRLEARRQGDAWVFSVSDNGDGLGPEARESAFRGGERGRGLGLEVVRRIAEKLGGGAGVDSDGLPGHGCRFFFTLPAEVAGGVAAEAVAELPERSRALIPSRVRS